MAGARLVKRRGEIQLVSTCCPLPHGVVKGRTLRMKSPHEKRNPHPIELSPQRLRELADEIEKLDEATTSSA